MRKYLALLVATTASAEPKDKPLDVSEASKHADVYRDELGKLYVVPHVPTGKAEPATQWTFFGDGRTMYRQRVVNASSTNQKEGRALSLGIWAPRALEMPNAILDVNPAGASITCQMKDRKYVKTKLERVADDEAKKLFETAKFYPELWSHQATYFGRGDGTTYILVDNLRSTAGGHRLYIGPKGQMKHLPVVDYASDSAGFVVMTKAGRLEVTKDGKAAWKVGKKSTTITPLEISPNQYLVYRELGVYGQLGTVCEDQ